MEDLSKIVNGSKIKKDDKTEKEIKYKDYLEKIEVRVE